MIYLQNRRPRRRRRPIRLLPETRLRRMHLRPRKPLPQLHDRHLQRPIPRRQQILRRLRRLLSRALTLRPEDPLRHPFRRSGPHALRRRHALLALEEKRLRSGQKGRHRGDRRIGTFRDPLCESVGRRENHRYLTHRCEERRRA